MRVLLYFEQEKALRKSGIGRAQVHQQKSLESRGIEHTSNPHDSFDLAHLNTHYLASYRLMRHLQRKGIKVIVHGHSTKEDFARSFRFWKLIHPLFNRMIIKMYRRADAIITPTPYSKKLIENYQEVTCPVYAISNGIDLATYAINPEAIKAYKTFFNIKEQKVIIGIGLLFERKGILDFFATAKRMPQHTFIWFGHLQRLLTHPKITKAIRKRPKNVIMPGYIDGNIIKGALQAADAFFFPSFEETEGIVTLEALASRLPIVVRKIDVYDGWLADNKEVLMGEGVDDFVLLLTKVLNDDNKQMVEAGHKVAVERDLRIIGKQLEEVYIDVLSE